MVNNSSSTQTQQHAFEELLMEVMLFLDNPTLHNAIRLDKEWHHLTSNKYPRRLLGPWVKAYLRSSLFQTKKQAPAKPMLKNQPKPLPPQIINHLINEPAQANNPHLLLNLVFNNTNQKNLPTNLLTCAVAPTMAFIIAESLTGDLQAGLYAALMMFGIGMPASLLGGFHCCGYLDDMSVDLMSVLIGKMKKERRRKLFNALLNTDEEIDEDLAAEFEPIPREETNVSRFAPKPSIGFKTKLF